MNGFGIRNELRHYREQREADRRDAIVAKVCVVGLIVLLLLGVA